MDRLDIRALTSEPIFQPPPPSTWRLPPRLRLLLQQGDWSIRPNTCSVGYVNLWFVNDALHPPSCKAVLGTSPWACLRFLAPYSGRPFLCIKNHLTLHPRWSHPCSQQSLGNMINGHNYGIKRTQLILGVGTLCTAKTPRVLFPGVYLLFHVLLDDIVMGIGDNHMGFVSWV